MSDAPVLAALPLVGNFSFLEMPEKSAKHLEMAATLALVAGGYWQQRLQVTQGKQFKRDSPDTQWPLVGVSELVKRLEREGLYCIAAALLKFLASEMTRRDLLASATSSKSFTRTLVPDTEPLQTF